MRRYVFADEAGNFDFSTRSGASRYFIVCTVTLDNCDVGPRILDLRRSMVRDGLSLDGILHASEDPQVVRDRVFDLIRRTPMRIDATIMEKVKAQPQVRSSDVRFYKYGWLYHFTYVAPKLKLGDGDEILVAASSVGTAKKRRAFREAVEDVMSQALDPRTKSRLAFWPAGSDPCLVIADYCAWAIQRKWEANDLRSHKLIAPMICSEFDLWRFGRRKYY